MTLIFPSSTFIASISKIKTMVLTKKISGLFRFLLLGLLVFGCSGDDLAGEENYFHANIEGDKLSVDGLSGDMKSEKRISDFGTVDLFVIVRSNDGRAIEFLIHNYDGENTYMVGNGVYNDSWINYSQMEPAGNWNANKATGNLSLYQNIIQISGDTGETISGHFSFLGWDSASGTMKRVTEGVFNLQY